MKRFVFSLFLILPLGLSSCQCSSKPDIGPVEEASAKFAHDIQYVA